MSSTIPTESGLWLRIHWRSLVILSYRVFGGLSVSERYNVAKIASSLPVHVKISGRSKEIVSQGLWAGRGLRVSCDHARYWP